MVAIAITGICQPDKVNLRLTHIRQAEVLFQLYPPYYQQTKDGRATGSCFALIRAHQGGMICTDDSWITGCLYNVISTTSVTLGVGKRQFEVVSQCVLCAL